MKNNCLAQAHQLDLAVIELATKAIARLTQVSGMYTANLKFDFIDHEVKKAFEWLSAPERNEGRRHAAVMVLREIAYCMPTFFFQVHFPMEIMFHHCRTQMCRVSSSSLSISSMRCTTRSLNSARVQQMLCEWLSWSLHREKRAARLAEGEVTRCGITTASMRQLLV